MLITSLPVLRRAWCSRLVEVGEYSLSILANTTTSSRALLYRYALCCSHSRVRRLIFWLKYHWIFEEAEAEHEEEEEDTIDEDAVASDPEDIEEVQNTGASSSRLNMSEDEVFSHGPSQISLVTST